MEIAIKLNQAKYDICMQNTWRKINKKIALAAQENLEDYKKKLKIPQKEKGRMDHKE